MSYINKNYIVYNKFFRSEGNISKILKNEPNELTHFKSKFLINAHRYTSSNDTFSEVKVSWSSKDDYFDWRLNNETNYQEKRNKLEKYYLENNIKFTRYTSEDDYVSDQIDHPSLITNISLTLDEKKFFIDNILPLGKKTEYLGNGMYKENTFPIYSARFIKERQSSIERRQPSEYEHRNKTLPYFMFAYMFDHAIDYSMYSHPNLWKKLKTLCYNIEIYTEKLIKSCSNAGIIVGHKSFGYGLSAHSHRIDEENRPTLTLAIRLTDHDTKTPLIFKLYESYQSTDENLLNYYKRIDLVNKYCHDKIYIDIDVNKKSCFFVFDSAMTAHSTIWNDDIYIYFVYDSVEFKDGILEKIKEQSSININSPRYNYFYLM